MTAAIGKANQSDPLLLTRLIAAQSSEVQSFDHFSDCRIVADTDIIERSCLRMRGDNPGSVLHL
jgi:hypothetical protein